jgi:hypothetical protein
MRATSGVAAIALALGIVLGVVGSLTWSGRLGGELDDVRTRTAQLERELKAVRAQNDTIGAELSAEQARAKAISTDLQREKEINMRLHLLVSEGRK